MTTRVKTFIETHIDLIDNGRWDEFFCEWYIQSNISPDQDEFMFAELYEILIKCGALKSYLDTHDIRRNIIMVELQRECTHRIINGEKQIHFADLTYDLNSRLGFSFRDIESMIYSCFMGRYGIDDHYILISV